MKLTVKLGWLLPIGLMTILGVVAYFLLFFRQPGGAAGEKSGIAVSLCVTKCQEGLIKGVDTAIGPCLSNEIQKDWACDLAHKPRQAVDDKAENQCSSFREGMVKHFVEVDPNCQVIKIY